MIFKGIRISISKKSYIFVILRGVRAPCLPPLDPPMLFNVYFCFHCVWRFCVDALVCGVVFWCPFQFGSHLVEEERLRFNCDVAVCFMSLPHGAVSWSSVCECGISLSYVFSYKYSKPCLKRPLKKNTKIGFKYLLSLNAGQKYFSILQYFRPSLSYHFPLRTLFVYF